MAGKWSGGEYGVYGQGVMLRPHSCAGGRGVIEGLGGQMGLSKANLEPSFSSLYTYGNTSSASIWYS